MIDDATLVEQEERFARAFRSGDLEHARALYHPEVVYRSPTVRLYSWPERIVGVERTLEFIALTVRGLRDVEYACVERAIVDGAQAGARRLDAAASQAAFVRIHFDWTRDARRLRSNYVVIYRYREGRIGTQELYYDPSGRLEVLSA